MNTCFNLFPLNLAKTTLVFFKGIHPKVRRTREKTTTQFESPRVDTKVTGLADLRKPSPKVTERKTKNNAICPAESSSLGAVVTSGADYVVVAKVRKTGGML